MTSAPRFSILSLLALALCMGSHSLESQRVPREDKRAYAGAWWATADSEEKMDF